MLESRVSKEYYLSGKSLCVARLERRQVGWEQEAPVRDCRKPLAPQVAYLTTRK